MWELLPRLGKYLQRPSRILERECTQSGCRVHHRFWKFGGSVGALLGGGWGVDGRSAIARKEWPRSIRAARPCIGGYHTGPTPFPWTVEVLGSGTASDVILSSCSWSFFSFVPSSAGLKNVHPDMLRHSCGYYLVNTGVDLRTMQDYLGHRDPKHILHYTRVAGRRFEGLWK